MKKIFIGLSFLTLMSFSLFNESSTREIINYCAKENSKEKCKKALVPYRYSSMKVTDITFRGYNQIKDVTIPLFFDSKYRFVFNTEGLPHDIIIEIYDKHSTERKKKDEPLFTANSSQKQFNYEPEDGYYLTNIYVNYLIPAAEETGDVEKGCIVLMSGFENEISFPSDGGGDETN